MSAEFVPFLAGIKSRAAASVAPEAFAPIGAAKPPAPSPASALPSSPCAAPQGRETRVELKRAGDRITHIQVHCRCGEVIEVECEY